MRESLCIVLALFFFNFIYGQTVEKELSNVERFSAKSGTLIEKTFVDVGKLRDVAIKVLVITDLIEDTKMSGVRFEYEHKTSYASDTKLALLDPDEVDGLIKSINILQNRIFNTTKTDYTEVTFRSRGGFEAGCYYSKGDWKTYLKLEKYDKDSFVFLNKEDFTTLLNLLNQAKQKL